MGQYHLVVNLDKREFLHPHQLGDGLKAREHGGSACRTMAALNYLLTCSCKGGARGGGDYCYDTKDCELIGSWAGDRIAIVGDYAEPDDLPAEFKAESIYDRCLDETTPAFKDISDKMRPILEREYGVEFYQHEWGTWDLKDNDERSLTPDMVLVEPK